jgi:hypothetical protein
MPQDNTLGAPTEGLGQTVTFAANGSRGQSTAAGTRRQSVNNNPASGGAVLTARALQVPEAGPDATMSALMKLGEGIIQPKLEEARTAAFVQGMQKAAQGQAITEIVDEQPWYSKLFGSTSLVDGARAYTASSKAASASAEMEAKMPELRKLGANEFATYATQEITRQQTGDPATDMLAKQLANTLPAVMKGQAKAHLVYQQEQFVNSIGSAQTAAFANLGVVDAASRQSGATRDEADVLGAAIQASDVLVQPAEMDKETYDKVLSKSAVAAISGGNFAAYTLLKNTGKLASMDSTQAYYVERAYHAASSQAKTKVPYEFLDKVAEFQTLGRNPESTPASIIEAAKAINVEYANMTGDPAKFLGDASTVQELRQLREYNDARTESLRKARDTAVTKQDKELAEIAFTTSLAGRVAVGDGAQPYLMVSETPKETQAVFDHLRVTASPAVRNKVMVEQADVAVDQTHKGLVMSAISTALGSNDPAMLYEVYKTQYLPLVQAAGDNQEYVAKLYAGRHADLMSQYHSLAQGADASAVNKAIFYTEAVTPQPKALTATKSNKAIVAELTSSVFAPLNPFSGEIPLKDPEGYAAALGPKIDSRDPNVSSAIKSAELASPDLSRLGGYHWQKSTKATKLYNWLAKENKIGSENISKAFDATVKLYGEQAGIEGTPSVGQTTDSITGEPQLYLKGIGSDGNIKLLPFKASDIKGVWENKELLSAQENQKPIQDVRSVSRSKSPEQYARERLQNQPLRK